VTVTNDAAEPARPEPPAATRRSGPGRAARRRPGHIHRARHCQRRAARRMTGRGLGHGAGAAGPGPRCRPGCLEDLNSRFEVRALPCHGASESGPPAPRPPPGPGAAGLPGTRRGPAGWPAPGARPRLALPSRVVTEGHRVDASTFFHVFAYSVTRSMLWFCREYRWRTDVFSAPAANLSLIRKSTVRVRLLLTG
jgi:hypothetical protein